MGNYSTLVKKGVFSLPAPFQCRLFAGCPGTERRGKGVAFNGEENKAARHAVPAASFTDTQSVTQFMLCL